MMIKLFGILDLVAAILITLSIWNLIGIVWVICIAGYFILKGWGFFILGKDIASIIDLGAGLLIFIHAFFTLPLAIILLILVWIVQKAAFSFF